MVVSGAPRGQTDTLRVSLDLDQQNQGHSPPTPPRVQGRCTGPLPALPQVVWRTPHRLTGTIPAGTTLKVLEARNTNLSQKLSSN